jgi:hypothetical protein
MDTLTISRKEDLLKRAAMYHHTLVFLPDGQSYVEALLHEPIGFKPYDNGKEPIVAADDLYALDDTAWLTVNRYNAVILNTTNMLIADIDFGDARLDRHTGATSVKDVCKNLGELHLLDKELLLDDELFPGEFRFADQSYRIYRTHSGCRVICTSIAVPWDKAGYLAERFMQFLRGDPDYIKLCRHQKCYRARLTPKPWRDKGDGSCVCNHVSTEGNVVHERLKNQLMLHDELTLPETKDWFLA